jgi:hypothetical protein
LGGSTGEANTEGARASDAAQATACNQGVVTHFDDESAMISRSRTVRSMDAVW